ncbi:hypothetical protein D3C85_1758160 [compost metagenome]
MTVSIAEAMIGRFSEIDLVSLVRMSTSAGITSDGPGSSRTSSKVKPSRIRPSRESVIVNSDAGWNRLSRMAGRQARCRVDEAR